MDNNSSNIVKATPSSAQVSTPNRRKPCRNPHDKASPAKSSTPRSQTPVSHQQQQQQQSRNKGRGRSSQHQNSNPNVNQPQSHSKTRSQSTHNAAKVAGRRVKPESNMPQTPVAKIMEPFSAASDVPVLDLNSAATGVSPSSFDERSFFAGATFWQSPSGRDLPPPSFCSKARKSPSAPAPAAPVQVGEPDLQPSSDSADSSSESDDGAWFTSDAETRASDSVSTATTTPGRRIAQLADDNELSPSKSALAAESVLQKEPLSDSCAPAALSPPHNSRQFAPPSFYVGQVQASLAAPKSLPARGTVSPPALGGRSDTTATLPTMSFNERISRARPGYVPASYPTPLDPLANDDGWPKKTQSPETSVHQSVHDGQRLDWASIYGEEGPRSPEIVSLENHLRNLLTR